MKNRLNKDVRKRTDDGTLITEFTIPGTLDRLIGVLNEVVRENHYSLRPLRFYQNHRKQQSFQVIKGEPGTANSYCCGAIDVIQRKENKVVVKFDSTRCSMPGEESKPNKDTLERFFVAMVQRLMQLGMIKKK